GGSAGKGGGGGLVGGERGPLFLLPSSAFRRRSFSLDFLLRRMGLRLRRRPRGRRACQEQHAKESGGKPATHAQRVQRSSHPFEASCVCTLPSRLCSGKD